MASQILLNLQEALGKKSKRTDAEQEFIMSMQNAAVALVEKGRTEGRTEGRKEGQLAGIRLSLRRVLTARKLNPSRADDARIEACTDLATLERWLDQALAARSVAGALRTGDTDAPARRRRSRSTNP